LNHHLQGETKHPTLVIVPSVTSCSHTSIVTYQRGYLLLCSAATLCSEQEGRSCLGAFAKLQRATISFVMSVGPSVPPSVHMEQLGSH